MHTIIIDCRALLLWDNADVVKKFRKLSFLYVEYNCFIPSKTSFEKEEQFQIVIPSYWQNNDIPCHRNFFIPMINSKSKTSFWRCSFHVDQAFDHSFPMFALRKLQNLFSTIRVQELQINNPSK